MICWTPVLLTSVLDVEISLSAKLVINCSRSCTRSGPRMSLQSKSLSQIWIMILSGRIICTASSNCLIWPGLFILPPFVCFVALRPKSTAMVIAGRSVHLTTLFPGQA